MKSVSISISQPPYLLHIQDRVPFAVVGSNRVMEMNGKKVRGRQYPWGTVEVDNLEHNDFLALRDMLIRYVFHQVRAYFYACMCCCVQRHCIIILLLYDYARS